MSTPGVMHPDQMQKSMKSAQRMSAATTARRRQRLAGWLLALAGIALIAAAGAGILRGHAQSPAAQNTAAASPAPANQQNMANAQSPASSPAVAPAQLLGQPVKQPAAGAAVDPRQQQAVSEAADLLKMATALKTEVDKTTKDTLSISVVRKAGEIEQLAHKVRLGTGKS